MMTEIVFFLGALIFGGLGALCLKNTSPYTRAGGEKFEKRGKRKLLAYLFFVIAGMSLIVAIIAYLANSP